MLFAGDFQLFGGCRGCRRPAEDPVVAQAEALGYTVETKKRKYGKWYGLSRDRHPEYDDVRSYAKWVLASLASGCFGPKN